MLDSIQILPNQWPTGAVIDWLQILDRVGTIPDRDKRIAEAEQILRARLNVQGTRAGLLHRARRQLVVADGQRRRQQRAHDPRGAGSPGWKDDMPRLVTGTLQRQQSGHWSTTVANAWGSRRDGGVLEAVRARRRWRAARAPASGRRRATTRSTGGGSADGRHAGAGLAGGLRRRRQQGRRPTWRSMHDGSGKPWVTVTSKAAVPVTVPFCSGYRITKTIVPVEQKVAGKYVARRRGARAPGHRRAGRRDLGGGQRSDPWRRHHARHRPRSRRPDRSGTREGRLRGWLAYQERSFEAFRAYYRYLPKGAFSVEYTVRLNNPGRFGLPQTRVEAMYAPEMFGESPNAAWTVVP